MTEARDADAMNDGSAEELVASIDATRDEMTDTVEAIGDRLDPGRIVDDAKQTVRDATVGRVETMTENLGDVAANAGTTIQQTGGGLVETIRRNPVPAAMVAFGVGWMATHRGNGNGHDRARQAWDRDTMPGRSSMHEPRGFTGPSHMDDGRPMTEQVGRTAEELGERARSSGSQLLQQIEREPLAAGAAAIAVGAAVGLLLPATRIEQDVIGPAGQRVLDTVEDATTDRLASARESMKDGAMGSGGSMGSTGSMGSSASGSMTSDLEQG